ncbi:Capon-like protein [Lucilia cuprina]|nr:Capon-like protein [Lucilia cuprina]
MPSTPYDLVQDDQDLRVPLHADQAFLNGITFQAKNELKFNSRLVFINSAERQFGLRISPSHEQLEILCSEVKQVRVLFSAVPNIELNKPSPWRVKKQSVLKSPLSHNFLRAQHA